MNLLITICARAGSKGLKNKNIRLMNGQPLVKYTLSIIESYINAHSSEFDQIAVALNTDSKELIDQVSQNSTGVVYIKRKSELAGDSISKVDVIRDTYKTCKKQLNCEFDITLDLDLTSPLRRVSDVETAIKKLKENVGCEVVFSAVESRRNPYFNMVREESGWYHRALPSNYTARQQAPVFFDLNASIYAYSKDFMQAGIEKQIGDAKALIVEMEDWGVLDIDSERDFKLMEILIKNFNND